MKNKRVTAYLCASLLLCMITGCGKSEAYVDVPKVEVVKVDNVDVPKADLDKVDNTSVEGNSQSDTSVEDGDSQQNNNEDLFTELDGDIESIGDNSVVINQVFHPSENLSVSYEDAEEKVLITVYFSEETEFEVWTIKNGGVNGDADVEKRQGSFFDLKQNTYISMTGSYNGNDFHAKQVIVHYYI